MDTSDSCPKIICDGEIEIIKLTREYHEEAVKIYMTCFVANENVCTATNLKENKVAVKEIEALFREILKDDISFAAKHIPSNSLAAICINKIFEPKSNCNLDEIFKTFKSPEMVFIGGYLDRMENTYNVYENLKIDCSMEVVFLSTKPEFERKGIARSLTLYSIEFARNLGNGLLSDAALPEHIKGKRPKAVTSVFTTKFTQIIGEKLGFETVVRVPYTEILYNGYAFADKLHPIHVSSNFAVKRL